MMKRVDDKEQIKEFLDLLDNKKMLYKIQKFNKPVLVYDLVDGDVRYSIWEASLLKRFGLENVDGWDFKDSDAFCPEWVREEEDYDDEDDDDDDFDLDEILDLTEDDE